MRRRIGAAAVLFALAILLISLWRGTQEPPTGPFVPVLSELPDGSISTRDWRGRPVTGVQEAAVRRFRDLGLPVYCGGGRAPYVALTFDDGPSRYSDRVLSTLEAAGAQATFFLVGRLVAGNEAIVRRQVRAGGVGNHTWDHPYLTKLSDRDARRQLASSQEVLERAAGAPVTLFRSPYEAHDARTDAVVRRLGLLQVLWNVDSQDYQGAGRDAVAQQIVDGLRPGAIMLMHETYDWSVNALPQILAAARQRGLRLVSVPALLALDPPTEQQVRAGRSGCAQGAG
jgi:peptidoglycan/xylan/chitin deacetylase (PgdA/CDA1 family)